MIDRSSSIAMVSHAFTPREMASLELLVNGLAPSATNSRRLDRLEVGGITRDMAESPPVDSARVARLKLAIEAGSYVVDSARIADAMIASETQAGKR